jgi:hypothetical protein
MITNMKYGIFLFFGIITFIGAGFIWFFFPETKGLSLEEMDIIFGSFGAAQADAERMREINREVGLEDAVRGGSVTLDEKPAVEEKPKADGESE